MRREQILIKRNDGFQRASKYKRNTNKTWFATLKTDLYVK